MKKFARVAQPEVLADRWEQWGMDWEQRRAQNGAAVFHWHKVDGVSVNQMLLPVLKAQTQDHCSFCDAFPVAPPSIDTIEHFLPKAAFPREAYHWLNLYYCCMFCQQKNDEYSDALLRPDDVEYEFDRYFRWDYTTGELKVNTLAPESDQHRAGETIRIYNLNIGHPTLRKMALRNRPNGPEIVWDEHPYRHYMGNV